MNNLKKKILELEANFCKLVKEKGIKEGFLYFAAEDAVLNRDNRIINGKKEIENYFNKQDLNNITLEWKPDYVDISKSEDMAYTYGSYTLTTQNDSGENITNIGIFHTVWKKQSDGTWKYVYD